MVLIAKAKTYCLLFHYRRNNALYFLVTIPEGCYLSSPENTKE